MDKYRLKLKKLSKKTLIQLIKRLRREVARLHGALDRITKHQDELQGKYEELQADYRFLQADYRSHATVNSEANTPGPKEVEEIEWRVTYTSNEDVKGYEQHCERIAAASPAEARDKLLTRLLWDSLRIRVISVKSLEKEVW